MNRTMKLPIGSRRVLTVALCCQLGLSTVAGMVMPLSADAAVFNDIQGHWAQADIQKLSDRNILGGYPDGTFRPQGAVTRAEFASILVKALGLSAQNTAASPTFYDVPASHWAFSSVETVRAQGLVSGYPDGSFHPAQQINRAEALVMMGKAARLGTLDAETTAQILSRFSDEAATPAWAKPSVAATLRAGIQANYPIQNQLRPQDLATRGEVAAMTEKLGTYLASGRNPNGGSVANNSALPGLQNDPSLGNGYGNSPTLQGRVTIVPAQTKFTGTVTQAISSEINRVGDSVTLLVNQPLVSQDNVVVVPWQSRIVGKITEITASGMTGKSAKMRISFSEIITPDNRRLPIVGSIATDDGTLQGGSTKGRVLKALGTTAAGAGLGAALGTAMGPLSGGGAGKGAIYGTILGSGVGAIAAGIQKGAAVVLTPQEQVEIKLDQSLTAEVGP